MNYCEIKKCDIANGEGVRTVLFVSGCTNHCEECFQPQTWDFSYGKPFDAAVVTLPMPLHRLKRRMGGLWLWVKGETNNPNKEV